MFCCNLLFSLLSSLFFSFLPLSPFLSLFIHILRSPATERAKQIENKAKINIDPAHQKLIELLSQVKQLMSENQRLRNQISRIRAKSPELVADELDLHNDGDDDGGGGGGVGWGRTAEVETQTDAVKKQGCCIVM